MTKKEREIKMRVWNERYDEICQVIADQEFRMEIIERLPPEEIVGQQETGGSMSIKGKRDVSAKEARESLNKMLKENNNRKEALERLMES